MILIALGSNQAGPWGKPVETVMRAIDELDKGPIRRIKASRLIVSAPYGKTNQAAFVNAVVLVATHLPPLSLMQKLHQIERQAGRRRALRWGPRTLDLDLIVYHNLVRRRPLRPVLPHPGIADRIFVLLPISEIAPAWLHPVLRQSARTLLRKLDAGGEGAEI